MNFFTTVGLVIAMTAALIGLTEFLLNLSSRQAWRMTYRRAVHPRNIKKTIDKELELEIHNLLDEELAKEKSKNKLEHPSNYKRTATPDLDGSTKEIISKLTNPEEVKRRSSEKKQSGKNWISPSETNKDGNTKYW